jgi:hypothetical protein
MNPPRPEPNPFASGFWIGFFLGAFLVLIAGGWRPGWRLLSAVGEGVGQVGEALHRASSARNERNDHEDAEAPGEEDASDVEAR